MPGLSQLKKFNADILSLGNEPGLRASRGEKPVTVPIPKGIEDVDDSDDFITGMPEPVEYDVKPEKAVNVEEDFLLETFGEEYLNYKKKVCRYIGRKRKMS